MSLIMGKHAVEELLLHAPHRLIQLFTLPSKADAPLVLACQKAGVAVTFVRAEELTRMVGTDAHQSFVAKIKQRAYLDLKEFLANLGEENALVLMLDQIFDPQNFGALLRAAECFGVSAVVWSKNRGCDLTPAAAKSSCGASELVPLIQVSNLAETAERFKKEGFEVVASLLDAEAESLYAFTFAPRTLLIMGSEGEGIQPLLRKKSDRAVYIPMRGKVASLNVSQAASVLLSHALGRRK